MVPFNEDDTFQACYTEMGIESSGTYTAKDDQIDMDQTKHTLGLIGQFLGRYSIDGDILIMNLGDSGADRPIGLDGKNRRTYKRILGWLD